MSDNLLLDAMAEVFGIEQDEDGNYILGLEPMTNYDWLRTLSVKEQTMRLIDADALSLELRVAKFSWCDSDSFERGVRTGLTRAINGLDSAPSIDICFCRECKHYNGKYCFNGNATAPKAPNANDFCSWGERRADDEYERAVEQMEYDMLYEPTYNPEDGSM